jgi:hypothetical protein
MLGLLLSVTGHAAETSKCFNNEQLKERKAMIASYIADNFDIFAQQYAELCAKYAAQLECKVERSAPSLSNNRMLELVKGDKCAEVMNVSGETEDLLYFLTDRATSFRNSSGSSTTDKKSSVLF